MATTPPVPNTPTPNAQGTSNPPAALPANGNTDLNAGANITPQSDPAANAAPTDQTASSTHSTTQSQTPQPSSSTAPNTPQSSGSSGNPPARSLNSPYANTVTPKAALSPTQPLPTNPSVVHGSVLNAVATALTGGPRFKESIDPNTGTISRTQVPVSTAHLGMAIAMEFLGGMARGAGVPSGPGFAGRAAAAGFAGAQQDQKDAQQQQSKATAAQGAAFEQNSRAMLNTAQAERQGVESLKDAVTQNASLLENATDAGQVDETHISQDDLSAGMKSGKYNATQQLAIPDGFTNINGKFEQTFAIVKDPSAKVPLTQAMFDQYAAAGVPGYTKGTKIPANGASFTVAMQLSANHQMQANNQMKQDVASVEAGLTQSGDPAYQEMAKSIPDFGKLLSDPQTGPTLQSALGRFQKYISHSDMHGNDLFESLKQMAAPSKPNPQNPKQSVPNGDAAFANTIAGAFGSGDPQKGWEILKAYHDAVTPDPIKNKDQAESILADPTSTSKAKLQAKSFLTIDANTQAADAAAKQTPAQKEEQNLRITKLQNDIANAKNGGGADGPDYFKNDPQLGPLADPSNTSSDGINHKFLDAIRQQDPGMANLAYRMATGLDLYSTYGMARNVGEKLGALVSTIAPGFSKGQAEAYFETQKRYSAGGRMGNTISAGNTMFEHLNGLNQTLGALETMGPSGGTLGQMTEQQGRYHTLVNQASQEIATFYANGLKPNEQDIEDYKKGYRGTPSSVRAGLVRQAQAAMDKVQENYNQWRSTVPSSFVPPIPFVSPQAAQAYTKLTGQNINPELMQGAHTIGDYAPQGSQVPVANGRSTGGSGTTTAPSAQPNTPPAGTFPIRRGGAIVGYKAANGNVTYF